MQNHALRLTLPALASVLLFGTIPAAAQTPGEDAQTIQGALTNVRLLDPELESPVRSAVPAVVLSSLRGDGEVRAQAGFPVGQLSAVLAASAPFTGKASDPDTELATEAGLAGGTTLSLTISGLVWGPSRITSAQEGARERWCEERQDAGWFTGDEIKCNAISRSKLVALGDPAAPLPKADVDALVVGFNAAAGNKVDWCSRQKDVKKIPHFFSCTNVSEASLQELGVQGRTHPPDSVRALVREFDRVSRLGWDIPVQYGLQGKISPQSFDFLDAATLAEGSESHLAYSIGGGVGVFVRPFTRLDAEVSYERAFKAARSTQVCTPLPPPGTSQCGDAILGGPTQTDGWVAEAGVRQFLRVGGLDVALNPRVRFRNEDETYTVRVPIYFLPDKSGTSLLGGIAPTWSSETERFGIALFVGSAFNLDAPIR
jgi:hypothetical protein